MVKASEKNKIISMLKSLDVILLTLIICMNINKYYLGGTNERITYPVYLLFILISFWINTHKINLYAIYVRNIYVTCSTILLCVSSLFGSLFLGWDSVEMTLKLYISLLIALSAKQFSIEKIRQTIQMVLFYNVVYGMVLVIAKTRTVRMMASGVENYLNLTLTLGLVLSILLCQILLSVYGVSKKGKGFIAVFLTAYILFVMSGFNARGSILLPTLVVSLMLLFLMRQMPLRVFGAMIVVLFVGYIGFRIYVNTVSKYALSRMIRLLNNIESEKRVILWDNYWREVLHRHWYLLGGGPNSSRIVLDYYPHNLYLQLTGEFGLIGIVFFFITTFAVFTRILRYWHILMLNKNRINHAHEEVTLISTSGLIYYFLTFMKSFSFYDACPLFIFYAFTMKCTENPYMFLLPADTVGVDKSEMEIL